MRTTTFLLAKMTVAVFTFFLAAACSHSQSPRWYKGNTHTHTLWSDGDAAPEIAVAWYKDHGYDWLSLTDHDVVLREERWYPISANGRLSQTRLSRIRDVFGIDWITSRIDDGIEQMRLKTLSELRDHFEEPGTFLLVDGEEIGDRSEGRPLHFNVLNIADMIPAQGGATIELALANNIQVVNNHAESTGINALVHFNHPNYHWAVTAEQLGIMEGTDLFELYNGSTDCYNYGDSTHAGMDELWDAANTIRLSRTTLGPLYGIATDDTHDYFDFGPDKSNPGRGWIMVRADTLSADALISAMLKGDFYSSTGVELHDVIVSPDSYVVEIATERGITYTTRFIGTRLVEGIPGTPGEILHETDGPYATYRFHGDELFVRAKIISSRMQANPLVGEEAPEQAWTQPVLVNRR